MSRIVSITVLWAMSLPLVGCGLMIEDFVADDKDAGPTSEDNGKSDTNTDTDTDTDTDSNVDTGTDSNVETDTDTDTDANTETKIDIDTESSIDTGTGTAVGECGSTSDTCNDATENCVNSDNGTGFYCECKTDFVRENGVCIDTKQVDCQAPAIENSTPIVTTETITYTTVNGWSAPPVCQWNCSEEYHSEDGETCVSNSKSVPCVNKSPANASPVMDNTVVTWNGTGWSTPSACQWTCDADFRTEDNSTCVSNIKEVPCTEVGVPENAKVIAETAPVTWTNGAWPTETPVCPWICFNAYHTEDDKTCTLDTKTVDCSQDNLPENATAQVVQVEVTWTESAWPVVDCEWTCNQRWKKNSDQTACVPCDAGLGGDNCDTCFVYVKANGFDGNTGLSWTLAKRTVQAGLDAAEQFIGSTEATRCEVWVAKGTYVPTTDTNREATFQLKPNVAMYGGFDATETVKADRDPVSNTTTLSGEIGVPDDPTDNVIHVVTGVDDAVIDGFTITQGYADIAVGDGFPWGGGMYNYRGSPKISNCIFTENYADSGGGMYNGNSSPEISNCVFMFNTSRREGGGMRNGSWGTPTITNCTFYENKTEETPYAGGMFNSYGHPKLVNCILSHNRTNTTSSNFQSQMQTSPTTTNLFIRNTYIQYDDESLDCTLLYRDTAAPDLRLHPDSTCINAGDTSLLPVDVDDLDDDGDTTEKLPIDLAGNDRVYGGNVDIGAYEYSP